MNGAHMPQGPNDGGHRRPGRRSKYVFWRCLEIVAIAVSFLGRNAIARFLAAKVGLDFTVEVTAAFGRDAGHKVSTIVALIVAEPRLIAVLVAGIFLIIELVFWILRMVFRGVAHPRARR